VDFAVCERSAAAEGLMRAVLRDGRDLRPEYPLVFQDGFDGRVVIAHEDEGAVRSTCATLVRDLVTPRATLRIGLTWAEPPTRLTEIPTFTAGRTPE